MYRRAVVFGMIIAIALMANETLAWGDCRFGFDPVARKCFAQLPPPLPKPPSLIIRSDPPGAFVSRVDLPTHNVEPLGALPEGGYRLPAGPHHLVLSFKGYANESEDVIVASHGVTTWPTVKLTPLPTLTVRAKDNSVGGDVLIDGKTIGKLPIDRYIIDDPGIHTVEIRRAHYESWEQVINQLIPCPEEQGKRNSCWRTADFLTADLQAKHGRIGIGHLIREQQFNDELVGLAALVMQGKKVVARVRVPDSVDVAPGDYEVRISAGWHESDGDDAPCAIPETNSTCIVHVDPESDVEIIPRFGSLWNIRAVASKSNINNDFIKKAQCELNKIPSNISSNSPMSSFTPEIRLCMKEIEDIVSGRLRDPDFTKKLGKWLMERCNDDDGYLGSCSGLAYMRAHQIESESEPTALKLYMRECNTTRTAGCLGAQWLLRQGPKSAKDEDERDVRQRIDTAVHQVCSSSHSAECFYPYTKKGIDPTKFSIGKALPPKPPHYPVICIEDRCLQIGGLIGALPAARTTQLEAAIGFHLPWKRGLGFYLSPLNLRFRTLEQVEATTHKGSLIYEIGVGYEAGLFLRIHENVIIRGDLRGSVYVQSSMDASIFNGVNSIVDLSVGNVLIGLGLVYEQVPVRALILPAFGTNHVLESRDYRWGAFVHVAVLSIL